MLKYKLYVFLLFIVGILSINIVYASNHKLPLLGKVIYLDAGHPSEIKPSINRTSCSK